MVRHVHDGDTLWLNDGRKLRLIGIDTPELARDQRPADAYAEQAREALRQLVRSSDYRISLSYGPQREDRYNRTLAHLYLLDGTSVQGHLLRQGLATAFTTPPNDTRSACYREAETQAMKKNRGIWSLPRYQSKTLQQLSSHDRGFHRIRGRVTRVYFGKKAVWIHLGRDRGKSLRLRINHRDLANFDRRSLQTLQGKSIAVRGWLHPRKDHIFMALRHRDALIIDNNTD